MIMSHRYDSGAMTRREALCQAGTGLGMLGLFGLLGDCGYLGTAAQGRRSPAAGRRSPLMRGSLYAAAAALPGQGEARHPHLPERRAVAGRHVRPQAAAQEVRRQDAAAGEPDDRAEDRGGPAVAVSVPEVRPERHRGQRDLRQDGRAHRRHLRDPLDAGQHAQSRAVDAADELRRRAAVAPEHGGLDHLRPGHRRTRTCPASSRCAPACRSPTSPTGARRSCPASTREPTSTPAATRSRN